MAKTQIRLDTQAQNATLTPDKVSTVATDDFSFPRDVSAGRDLKVTDGNKIVLSDLNGSAFLQNDSTNFWVLFQSSNDGSKDASLAFENSGGLIHTTNGAGVYFDAQGNATLSAKISDGTRQVFLSGNNSFSNGGTDRHVGAQISTSGPGNALLLGATRDESTATNSFVFSSNDIPLALGVVDNSSTWFESLVIGKTLFTSNVDMDMTSHKIILGNSGNAWIKFDTSYVRIATPVSFEDGVITAQDGANLNINLLGTGIARFDHVSNGGPATGLNLEGNDIFDTNSLSFSLGAQISPITTGQSTTQLVSNSNSSYFNFADVDFGSSDWDAFNFTPNAPANGIGIVFTEDKATYIGRHNNNLGLFGAPNIFLKGNLTLSAKVLTTDTALMTTNDRENNVILIDASAGDVTITISVNSNGWWYFFKRIDSSANAVTISSTDLIDGAASYPLTTQYQCVELLSDYTTWQILGTNSSGGSVSFPLYAPDGNEPNPSYSFASNHGTGISMAANTLAFSIAGTAQVYFNKFPNTSTIEVISGGILIDEFGSLANPSVKFGSSGGSTGFFSLTQDNIAFSSSGTETSQLTTLGIGLSVDGDEINPSLYWSNHAGWGIYYDNGFSAIGMSTGSGKALTLDNTGALTLYQGAGGYLLDGLMKLWSDNQAVYLDNQSAGRGGAPLLIIRDSSETVFYNLNDSSLDMVSKPIINVTDPTNPQDAATKAYVDAAGPTVATVTMSSYTAAADHIILADAASNAITVNLPAASGNSGMQYVIKKIDTSVNTVTIDGNASETIDGALTYVETTQYESVTIVCDGSNWFII